MLRLTDERMKRGWSKAEVARRARLDQALISKFEARRATPYERELRRLAQALGFSADQANSLLDEVPTP